MGYPDIFNPNTTEALIARVEQLTPETQPLWGKMTVDQMLAHCSLAYEYNNGQRQTKIPAFMKWLLRGMMRRVIAGERPYKKNSPTASYFKVGDTAVFTVEKDPPTTKHSFLSGSRSSRRNRQTSRLAR